MNRLKLTWQYNGFAPMVLILEWCEEHIVNAWTYSHETIYFYTEEDLTMFLLRWA